jgi:maltooligosyltrehalose trehalohydrolase
MLFMGEEWGATTPWQFFTAHPEPELGRATAEGRIREFARMGWDPSTVPDPQAESTFLDSKLRWDEIERPRHAALLDLFRGLVAARREHPALLDPSFAQSVDFVDDRVERWIVVRRAKGVTIAANLAGSAVSVPAAGSVIVATGAGVVRVGDQLFLPARSAAVLLVTRPEDDDQST